MKNLYRIFMLFLLFSAFCKGVIYGQGTAVAAKQKTAKPNLTVLLKEVSLENAKLQKDANGHMVFTASVQNHSSKGTIRKIEYVYSISVRNAAASVETGDITSAPVKATVTLTATNIKPGKISDPVQCDGDESGQLSAMKLTQIRLYAGTALYTYDAATNKGTTGWGTKDQTPPVISGRIGKNSYCGNDVYLVCYSNEKNNFNFTKYVSATDNRDGTVKVTADTSKINWNKNGIYKLMYTAVDKAGNKASAWAKIQVFVPGTAEQIADSVLRSITKKDWSNERKCRAIYKYVRGHCAYVASSSHVDWRTAAVRGLRYQSGDCYTYYSISKLLLTRAGIPNITITRYPSHQPHWWNLAMVNNQWYHFDTTPRTRKGDFCLLTDSQMWSYSRGTTFQFQKEKYPKRATKKISKNP